MEKKTENIKMIGYPNTVADNDKAFFMKESGYTFVEKFKNGEMALIAWIEIYKDGKIVAEIKESVCDIYYL